MQINYSHLYPNKDNKGKRLRREEIRTSMLGVTRTKVDFNSHMKRQTATEYQFEISSIFYSKYTQCAESQLGPRRYLLHSEGLVWKGWLSGQAPQAQPAGQGGETARFPLTAEQNPSFTWPGFIRSPFSYRQMNVECNEFLRHSRATRNIDTRFANRQMLSVNQSKETCRWICDIHWRDTWTSSDILCHNLLKVLQRTSRMSPCIGYTLTLGKRCAGRSKAIQLASRNESQRWQSWKPTESGSKKQE